MYRAGTVRRNATPPWGQPNEDAPSTPPGSSPHRPLEKRAISHAAVKASISRRGAGLLYWAEALRRRKEWRMNPTRPLGTVVAFLSTVLLISLSASATAAVSTEALRPIESL